MVEKHIRFSLEDSIKIKMYAASKGYSFNKAIKELIKIALDENSSKEHLIKLDEKVNKLLNEQKYSIKLQEQTYSDFQFDNFTNPNLCSQLNEFKKNIRKSKIND